MPCYKKLAVCPFYEREAVQSVTCEGAGRIKMHTLVKFETVHGKKFWFDSYCSGFKYKSCPYAKMIVGAKYNEPI